MTDWTIIEYEAGIHSVVQNHCGRLEIPSILPMIEEFSAAARKKIRKPALRNKVLIPADEDMVQTAMARVRCLQRVWRLKDGSLARMSQSELNAFLDSLDVREKKAKSGRGPKNVADLTELDFFNCFVARFGMAEAMKRFGRDLAKEAREKEAA